MFERSDIFLYKADNLLILKIFIRTIIIGMFIIRAAEHGDIKLMYRELIIFNLKIRIV